MVYSPIQSLFMILHLACKPSDCRYLICTDVMSISKQMLMMYYVHLQSTEMVGEIKKKKIVPKAHL